jgi:predicted N-acetyltransferase YhbS
VRLADDGELCVRGPYVMAGYLDPPAGETSFDAEGWLHTGDLMQRDADGHYRLVDRKKEIYKNVKGETIAPQRIESLFRDFESVARVFLVGDHREYNTLLIWPNYEYRELDLRALEPQELKAHFRSLVVSVNKFLSPFERIVDFAVLPRDLDAAHGELTDKGTPRRKQVVESFRDTIRLLYRRTSLQVGGLELTLPNWLLQALGLTAQDIVVVGERIVLPHESRELSVAATGPGLSRVGSVLYRHPPGPLSLGALLRSPRLWLGNEELFEFAPLDLPQRQRPGRNEEGLQWAGRPQPYAVRDGDLAHIEEALGRAHRELADVHLAALLLSGDDTGHALAAIRLLETLVADKDHALAEPARLVLSRGAHASDAIVARRAFTVLVPAAKPERFAELVPCFLERWPELLDETTRAEIAKKYLPPEKVDAFLALAEQACLAGDELRAGPLLCLLAAYGAAHPASFRRLRTFLARMAAFGAGEAIRARAESSSVTLRGGFHAWLGPSSGMAVDPETEQEYHWEDVVVFDEHVPDGDRARMLEAIRDTPMIRESSFLFGNGVMIRLDDIPPGGVWIRPLGERHGKAVYRVTIQTRFHGGLDMALNLNRSLGAGEAAEEMRWLMLASGGGGREPLCEDFGGYWPRQDLWTEEFIAGETLDRALRRLCKRDGDEQRLRQLWPFLAWTGLSAYVDFWHRTGERFEVADPDPSNVIVPTDDYHTGVRIISVSARRPHRGLSDLMSDLMRHFIRPAVEQYPALDGLAGWDVVFSSVLEILGEGPGLVRLERVAASTDGADAEMLAALGPFVEHVRVNGFLPRRLHFAVERYRRWAELSADATPQARARMLHELYETYGLGRLNRDYPESRLRFFRETAFRDGAAALAPGLDGLIARMRRRELGGEELIDAVAELRRSPDVAEDADYFLARLSLPHLRPEDAADFVSSELGGRAQSEIVVTLEDQDGRPFRVRHALNPKEVGRLLRLYQAARLDVRFRPEHRYLVAVNDREQIVGGIYYEVEEDGSSAHLEKIVVAEAYRRKGVADGLMHEFLNRLRSAGVRAVTTGFFRPGYFYKFGFRIEKRYAGLVKSLD